MNNNMANGPWPTSLSVFAIMRPRRAFFTAVLAPIGLHMVYDTEVPKPLPSRGTPAPPGGEGPHIAFNAPTRASVA
ncbi:hypothetical protein B0H19DRAFT_1247240 [Mycena capillaripes]|nr:hypothetical protein B0H19DRAFT_1247240 [Mycena capillaripes]